MTAWWQHAASELGLRDSYIHIQYSYIRLRQWTTATITGKNNTMSLFMSQKGHFHEGQGNPHNHHSVPDTSLQHGDSMLSPVSDTAILQP